MFLSCLVWFENALGVNCKKKRIAKPAVLCCRERISGELLELILLLLGGGEKKIKTAKRMQGFAFSCGLDAALAGAHRLDGGDESRQHRRFGHWEVVRAQHEFQSWCECRDALRGIDVGIEIGFRPEEPNGSGIVSVARKEQAVFTVEQRDGVGRVPGRG